MKFRFSKDLYRYYGENGETFIRRMFRPPELKYISLMRKAQNSKNPLFKMYYTARLKRMSFKTLIQIPARTQIDEGFYIGHSGRIVIHPDARLGKNINVGTGVTIGMENRGKRQGVPTFEGNCWIGTNAVIVGNVKIGKDVLIAPLSYVNFDVPDHSLVIGNPARIIPRDNATYNYLCNCI